MTSQGLGGAGGESSDQKKLQQEIRDLEEQLIFLAKAQETISARSNTSKDISLADDSETIIVSTIGDLLQVRPIDQARAKNLIGNMSGATLRQLSQDVETEPTNRAITKAVVERQHNEIVDKEDASRVRHNSE
jgi:hypothetical protein